MSGTEALEKPLATLAFCWRIERRDGVTIGLTSHDRDLEIGHMLYRAAPGMTPSAVRSGIGLEGADSDVEGALVADAISEADLAAGHHVALVVPNLELRDVVGRCPERCVGLRDHLVRATKAVEVVHVQ